MGKSWKSGAKAGGLAGAKVEGLKKKESRAFTGASVDPKPVAVFTPAKQTAAPAAPNSDSTPVPKAVDTLTKQLEKTADGTGFGFSPSQQGTKIPEAQKKATAEPAAQEATAGSALRTTKEGVGIGIAPSEQKSSTEADTAAALSEYMALADQADFAEQSTAGDGNLSRIYLGPRYRYINDIGGMQDSVNGTGNSTADLVVNALSGPDVALARQGMGQVYGNQYRLYDQMTKDEVNVLNYLVSTRGEKEAEQYLKLLEPTLTARQAAEEEQVTEDISKVPVLRSVVSVPLMAAGSLEGGMTLIAGAGGKELTSNDSFRVATRMATGIRDTVTGKMTPTGAFFYQTGMSMLDTAFRLPFGDGGLVITGLSAASQTAQQAIDEGATTEQAVWLAGISGSLEIITEKVSLDNLVQARLAGTLPGYIKAALIQGGVEASEETASAIGNIISDAIIRKDQSDWNRMTAEYMQQGMTREEAEKQTLLSQAYDVSLQAAGGFASGLFFGAGGQFAGTYEVGQQQGASGLKSVGVGMKTAAQYDAAEKAYRQAMKTSARYTAEERVAIARDISASGLADETKDNMSRLIDMFARQPEGWLTERGQKLTELAIQATRQAADNTYVFEAEQAAKQTRALARLNTMFTDIQTAYKATETALASGDFAAHTKAVEATTVAIEKYNSAYQAERADAAERAAKREAEARSDTAKIADAGRALQAQTAAEVDNHAQIVAAVESQNGAAAAPDAQGLTSQPTTGIVSTAEGAAQEAPAGADGGKFDLVGYMLNPNGVPVYQKAAGETSADLMSYMLNGGVNDGTGTAADLGTAGSENRGDTPQPASGAGETGDAEARGLSGTRPGAIEGDRGRSGTVGGAGTSGEALLGEGTERGPLVSSSVARTAPDAAKRAAAIQKFVSSRNAEIADANEAGAGIEPIATSDVQELENFSGERAHQYFEQLRGFTGREVFFYAVESGRTDIPAGFANNGMSFVRYQPDHPDIMVFHGAHEHAHNMPTIQKAGKSVVRTLEKSVVSKYIAARSGDLTEKTRAQYEAELVSDMFGACMYDLVVANAAGKDSILDQLGVDVETFETFQDAFITALEGKGLEEETLEAAAKENLTGAFGGADSMLYSPMIGRTEDGTPIYKSIFPRGMSTEQKRAKIKQLDEEVWSKKPITLTVAKPGEEPIQIVAKFDPTFIEGEQTDVTELMYGQNHKTSSDKFRTINLTPDIYELTESSPYVHSLPAKPKDTYAHRGVREFHYYVSRIIYEREADGAGAETIQEPVEVVISVKDKGDEQYVYGFSVKKIKAPETQTLTQDAPPQLGSAKSNPADASVSDNTGVVKPGDTRYSEAGLSIDDDAFADEAMRLYKAGVTFMEYIGRQDYDAEVGKVLNRLWDAKRNVRIMRTASQLFAAGKTPEQYWEENQSEFDGFKHQVQLQLLGMYLRNGVDMGGRLAEIKVDAFMEKAGDFKQYRSARMGQMSPVRVFENLPASRKVKTAADEFSNFMDGEAFRRPYFDFTVKQNAMKASFSSVWRGRIVAAFKGGTIHESNLAQLLGERVISSRDASKALYDGGHMLVPAFDGWILFESSGNLVAFSDGKSTFRRMPRIIGEKVTDRMKSNFTEVQGSISVKQDGTNAKIHVPGMKAEIQINNGRTPNVEIAERLAETLKDFYSKTWETLSRVLVQNGYRPAGKIEDYLPHIGRAQGGLDAIIQAFVSNDLPTQIAGLTAMRKPGKPWAPILMQRMGDVTEFDAIRGFNRYIKYASDVIFMTPVIQRLRQLESAIRTNAGILYDEKVNSTFATWLRSYTNSIANKKSDLDRGAEDMFGRETYAISDAMTMLISRSAVQGNVSSALSNLISYIAAQPTLSPESALKGTRQALIQSILAVIDSDHYDGFADRIPFLQMRYGTYEAILTKPWQKFLRVGDRALGAMFAATDRFSTEAVARAKYYELKKIGYTDQDAAMETSTYCVKLFADRSKGMAPNFFNAKLVKPWAQFQLEAVNQLSHFRDIKRQGTGETIRALSNPEYVQKKGYSEDVISYMLGQREEAPDEDFAKLDRMILASKNAKGWIRKLMYIVLLTLWNELMRWLIGRDVTINPYGLTMDAIQGIENGDSVAKVALNTGKTVMGQLPYGGTFTGGRVPIGTTADKFGAVFKDIYNGLDTGELDTDKTGQDAMLAALSIIPGGGQARKILTGMQALEQGGYYTDTGRLRYPVTKEDAAKALIFGPSSVAPEGYEWGTTLSPSKTATYEEMVDAGMDPQASYELLMSAGKTNATQGLSILTTDADGDGRADFGGEKFDFVAHMLGLSYDRKKDGTPEEWVADEAARYKKNAEKDGITPNEQETIDSIDALTASMLGLKRK